MREVIPLVTFSLLRTDHEDTLMADLHGVRGLSEDLQGRLQNIMVRISEQIPELTK